MIEVTEFKENKASKVKNLMMKCMYKEHEIENNVPEGAIVVDGIMGKFGFHPGRVVSVEDINLHESVTAKDAVVFAQSIKERIDRVPDGKDSNFSFSEHQANQYLALLSPHHISRGDDQK